MKVKVVAYKEHLILIPNNPAEDIGKPGGWYPTGDGRIGCVLTDTKARLGISEEAFDLMKSIPHNNDAIGDISWWECEDGTWAFCWFGSIHRIINAAHAEGDRGFHVTNKLKEFCTIIPNDVPGEAKTALDHSIASEDEIFYWKEPHLLDGVILQGHEDDVTDNHCDCGDDHCF